MFMLRTVPPTTLRDRLRSLPVLAALMVPAVALTVLVPTTATAAEARPVLAAAASAAAQAPGSFVAVSPAKVIDTRSGTGTPKAPIAASGVLPVTVTGRAGVPATGVAAVAVQITAVNPAANGWLTAYATGTAKPGVANLNWVAGRSAIATVIVAVSAQGSISLFNGAAKPVDVVVDVQGYVVAGTASSPGAYVPVTPSRSLDTRTGAGAPRSAWVVDGNTSSATLAWQVTGRTGVPAGAVAAVMSVTATNATGPGRLTVFEEQAANPALEFNGTWTAPVSGMPFEAGIPSTNLQVVALSRAGKAEVSNLGADSVDVMADVVGYVIGGGTTAAGLYQASPPSPVGGGALAANSTSVVRVDGTPGSTVALTVTSTGGDWGSLYVYPHGTARPAAPQIKLGPARPSMATVFVTVPVDGTVDLFNQSNAAVDVAVDQYGWFRGSATAARTVWTWGSNDTGQLAHGATSVGSAVPAPVAALAGVLCVAGADRSGYAVRADGTMVAWGKNSNDDNVFSGGQLGDGSNGDSFVPVPVRNLTGVVQMAVDYQVAYALRSDGTVWSWGEGTTGESGDPEDVVTAGVPVKVPGLTGVVSITTTANRDVVAVRQDGTVWTWKQLPGSVPAKVAGLSGIKAANGTSLLRTDGRVQTGTTVLPGLSGITAVNGSYALKSDGTVWKLDGTKVSGLSGVAKIGGGGTFGQIALTTDGSVWQLAGTPAKVPNLPKIVDIASSAGSATYVIAA